MAPRTKDTKLKPTDADFVRMYYEHQNDRVTKHEDNRLAMTNYVLTVSALAFTFGYQNIGSLTIITGIGLPLIIMLVNIFAVLYIERTAELIHTHQDRAHAILAIYAPELQELNEKHVSRKGNLLRTKRGMQKAIHLLLILVALIPVTVFLYHVI